MALTWSQDRAYKDVIDLYDGELDLTAASSGFVKGMGVPTKILPNIRCLIMQTDYDAMPTPFGRSFKATLLTNDVVEMEVSVPIKDAQFFFWKTSDGAPINKWFAVAADPQSWPSSGAMTSNYLRIRCKECVNPTLVPSNEDVA